MRIKQSMRRVCVGVSIGAAVLGVQPLKAQPPPGDERPSMDAEPAPPDDDGSPPGRTPRRRAEGKRRPEKPIRWSELPEQDRRQIERFMEENMPQVYLRTQQLKDDEPEKFERRMSRIAPEVRRMMDTLRDDPERGSLMLKEKRLQFQMRDVADDYQKAADDAARMAAKSRLRELATEAFDRQNERRQRELRALESKVSDLKERLEEAQKMKESLVERRVEELLKAPDARPRRPRPPRQPGD